MFNWLANLLYTIAFWLNGGRDPDPAPAVAPVVNVPEKMLIITGAHEMELAAMAPQLASAIWDLDQRLRSVEKYSDDEKKADRAAKMRELLREVMEDNNFDFNSKIFL